MSYPPCEDAPCCGCCGTNIYGVNQEADAGPDWCDACGCHHVGPCLDDSWDLDPEDEDVQTWLSPAGGDPIEGAFR